LRKPSLLLIEDDDDLRTIMKEVLSDAQFDVHAVPHGLEGLKIYEQERIDLVITDIFMPKMDGLEVIQALRKKAPVPKIIAMSGEGSHSTAHEMLRCAGLFGATSILNKPFGMDELITAVKTALE
jgi:DNA-binding response OmpR family regulator